MKMLIWYGVMVVVVGLAVTMSGQSETPDDSSKDSSYIQTSKLVGRKVKSFDGKEIGIIKDIVIDRTSGYIAPVCEYTRMDEYARPDYINNVYSYYGVSPGPRVAVAPSSGAKAGTDVTGTAGATASPGEVVSSAATGTGSANKKSSARTHASSAANSDRASDANPSPKPTRSARAIGTRP